MNPIIVFSKQYVLLFATMTILFTAISEGREASKSTEIRVLNWINSIIGKKADDKARDDFDRRTKTAAVSPATLCAQCVEREAVDKIQKKYGSFRNITVFSADPNNWKDPRVEVDPRIIQNSQKFAIGIVEVSVKTKLGAVMTSGKVGILEPDSDGKFYGVGSGVMINECLMVTDHHVAFRGYKQDDVMDKEIEIIRRGKERNGDHTGPLTKTSAQVVASGQYGGDKDYGHKDWAILKLANSVDPDEVIAPCYPTKTQAKLLLLSSASFFRSDKEPDGVLWEQPNCTVDASVDGLLNSKLWKTTCPAIPGVSGAPVYTKNPRTGRICAVGIIQNTKTQNAKAMRLDDTEFNVMIPFSAFMNAEDLKNIIEKNSCQPPIKKIFF